MAGAMAAACELVPARGGGHDLIRLSGRPLPGFGAIRALRFSEVAG